MKKILILLSVFIFLVLFSVAVYILIYGNLIKTYEYNGKRYRPGESFRHEDRCNTCSFSKKGEIMCTLMACNYDLDSENKVDLNFVYENGKYKYSGTVEKPTPCDTVEVDSVIRESYPEQVTLAITTKASNQICAQVISSEEVSGKIAVSEQAKIEVTYNGKKVEGQGVN